ncbi:MAG: sugar phosphate isomerase/epimerase [Ruminococcaceae bacterium]|nr:sugar phosphate isomerase/epimerase [Oscillospiraceae bacterium]
MIFMEDIVMKVALSHSGMTLNRENFENMKKSGIDAVEVGLGYSFAEILDYKAIAKFAADAGVLLWSSHLPFMPYDKLDMASLDGNVRNGSVEYYTELIKKLAAVGVDKFVIHPSREPIPEDESRAEHIKCAKESFSRLADNAAREGAVIAVEDLPRSCLGRSAEEMLDIISANDKLRVCFDSNHLMIDTNVNFLEKLADKIITVHISDFDFANERHWLPGEGKLVWQPIYKKLCEIGYAGPWLYEINFKCPKTIIRERDLTYADFYENAQTIFSGKEPQKPDFTTHKEHIGMWE